MELKELYGLANMLDRYALRRLEDSKLAGDGFVKGYRVGMSDGYEHAAKWLRIELDTLQSVGKSDKTSDSSC